MTDEPSTAIKPLSVEKARDVAKFYGVPQSLVDMMIVEFNGVAYPKEPFLLYVGHRKGIQAIEVTKPVEANGEWTCEARIFPKVNADTRFLAEFSKLSPAERERVWSYLTKPTVEWGKASKATVRMSTMQQWLPEMAIKRAVCRALRLFAGVGMTAFEELPEAKLEKGEVVEPGENVRVLEARAEPVKEETTLTGPQLPEPDKPATPPVPFQLITWIIKDEKKPIPANSGPAGFLKKTCAAVESSHLGAAIAINQEGEEIIDLRVSGLDEPTTKKDLVAPLAWVLERVFEVPKADIEISIEERQGS
jgi:hypothetical protein